MYFISGGLSVIYFSTRIFRDKNGALLLAGQGSYSSQSKDLAIRLLGLRDWIVDEKLVIDHISTKGQLRRARWTGKNFDRELFISFFLSVVWRARWYNGCPKVYPRNKYACWESSQPCTWESSPLRAQTQRTWPEAGPCLHSRPHSVESSAVGTFTA